MALLAKLKKWRINKLEDKFGDAAYVGWDRHTHRLYLKLCKLKGKKPLWQTLEEQGWTVRCAELRPESEGEDG